ncbi:chromobox domain-containing protein [Vairimorpha necatrix]|uniref:Chromobox domain-containing protein n=1 Tax=Vairimorpha necatrix TaxID=6039 RepID=A0AAX4JBG4_9MICR
MSSDKNVEKKSKNDSNNSLHDKVLSLSSSINDFYKLDLKSNILKVFDIKQENDSIKMPSFSTQIEVSRIYHMRSSREKCLINYLSIMRIYRILCEDQYHINILIVQQILYR